MFKMIALLWETYREWTRDNATRQGAALAYYALFACAPLLLIATAVAGAVFGDQASDELLVQLEVLTTPELARTVQTLVDNAAESRSSGIFAGTIGVLTSLYAGAFGMFQLQSTLNQIWGVRPNRQGGVFATLRGHLLAFTSVVSCGLLLLASVIGTMVLRGVAEQAAGRLPSNWPLWRAFQEIGGFLLAMLLISVIFKTLSDARPSWKQALVGAAMSSGLFLVGKHAIAFYLREIGTSSVFGAAGAVVAVLIYTYYVAQVVLFGAKFTHVWARNQGEPIRPGPHAVRVTTMRHEPA